MKVVIYGHARCGWCTKAKTLADNYNIKYEYRDTDDAMNLAILKKDLPNVSSVPQIWVNDMYVGGYEKFAAEIENTLGSYGQGAF